MTTLWLAAATSLLGSVYTFMNSAYYAWAQAVGAQNGVRADFWSYLNLGVSALCMVVFGYILLRIHRCRAEATAGRDTV